jgi:hypothetical protein
MGPVNCRHLTSLQADWGPISDSLHTAQGGNQAQSRWLMLAHGELRHESGRITLAHGKLRLDQPLLMLLF